MNKFSPDGKVIIGELRASFERQLAVYAELRDLVRAHFSKLILSRGDAGVLTAGIDKKMKLIERINQEREGIAGHIEFWQEHRDALSNGPDAATLNDILARTEVVIKEFLTEEEKLKQYVEKICKKDGGA